ncbi:hypothetical protein E0L36_18100 [Streptomyces sp. AJS327]|uniref:hypothetical protein n=1 Tax=Streptomyces sp. AJS327 TaxID=2545265 RepID=UPI0015DDEB0B|nr:hypothetical protein [Streptomyces sp. AJS327]MBA0052718.1 hypothetical protein [Streptomyces sp. AJS327]
MQLSQPQGASRLRLTALASGVALAVILPFAAATAGTDRPAPERRTSHSHSPSADESAGAGRHGPSEATGDHPPLGLSRLTREVGPETSQDTGSPREPGHPPAERGGDASGARQQSPPEPTGRRAPRPSSVGSPASCGPEVAAPVGVEAQTCVLTEGRAARARAYVRNATNSRLRAVLTLLGPDGRSLRVRCALPASGGLQTCETPGRPRAAVDGEPSREGGGMAGRGRTAVVEVATADGERLLLRAGSESPGGRRGR